MNAAMALKAGGLSWRLTRAEADRTFPARMLELLDRYHGQANGIFSCDEHYAGLDPSQGTELCTVVEAMFSLEQSIAILGDPVLGGSSKSPIMTAYRQRALACAAALAEAPRRPRDLKHCAPDAGQLLLSNVYGWFDRAERGVYVLTDAGQAALKRWPQQPIDLSVAAAPAE